MGLFAGPSIVVDEKEHFARRTSYADSSSGTPSTNFLPATTRGIIEDPAVKAGPGGHPVPDLVQATLQIFLELSMDFLPAIAGP
jgi:hypothetical protein